MAVAAPPSRVLGASLPWWLLIAPALILMLAFYAFPLAEVLWISFTEPEPGLSNYERLITSEAVQRVWITTLRICIITTVITLLAGYVVAYALSSAPPRVQRWMFLFILLPLWISVLVRAFAWVTILRRQGLINEALIGAGLIDEPLRLIWNEFGIAVGMVHYMIPYAVLPLYASMRDIDPRLVPAARGLGASRFEAFRSVFLPLTRPGIIAASVLVFIFSLGFYVTPAILGGGRTLMIAEYIKLQILDLIRWGLGTMMASTLLIAIVLLLWALSRIVDIRRVFGSG
ncbi:ABC transporter permease [Elioraea rosea]|uniref:ABC transporter permease n=1 Tax=Elioraea rosea TaxID=2492390 RepID=UPI00118305B8|nr:ABC transporter permease [Elioraea rosea]